MRNDKGIPNAVKFTSERQPSPEAKSKGWERRREAQEIMDMIMRFKNMTWKEIKDLKKDIKINPEGHTVLEVKLARYISSSKFTIDFLDRHVSKAPAEIDLTTKGIPLNNIKFVFEEFEDGNEENKDISETEAST